MNMISDFSTGSSQKESEPIEKRAEKVIEKITQQEKEIVPLLKKEQKGEGEIENSLSRRS